METQEKINSLQLDRVRLDSDCSQRPPVGEVVSVERRTVSCHNTSETLRRRWDATPLPHEFLGVE